MAHHRAPRDHARPIHPYSPPAPRRGYRIGSRRANAAGLAASIISWGAVSVSAYFILRGLPGLMQALSGGVS